MTGHLAELSSLHLFRLVFFPLPLPETPVYVGRCLPLFVCSLGSLVAVLRNIKSLRLNLLKWRDCVFCVF